MDETYGPFQLAERKILQAGVVSDTDSKLRWKLLDTKSSRSTTQNKITCILLLLMHSTYFKIENKRQGTMVSGKLGQSILKVYSGLLKESHIFTILLRQHAHQCSRCISSFTFFIIWVLLWSQL